MYVFKVKLKAGREQLTVYHRRALPSMFLEHLKEAEKMFHK